MNSTTVIDLDYLVSACRRAGVREPVGQLTRDLLDGGRTGAEVFRLRVGDDSFVLKSIPKTSWRAPGMERADSGEPRLWQHGIVRQGQDTIRWPVLDVCDSPCGEFEWMLMVDIEKRIRPRGEFTVRDSARLFEAVAQMHAAYYGSEELGAAPLPTVSGTTRLFTTGLLVVGRDAPREPAWVADFLHGFGVLEAFAPLFLECLGPRLGDEFLELASAESWKLRMDALPATLLHGDLRRANIGFDDDVVSLIDWELASAGPPGCDLQWHLLLHYWGYPPAGVETAEPDDELGELYQRRLTELLGDRLDPTDFETGWQLGWIRAVSTLGYVLADPLYPDGGTPDQRDRVSQVCVTAVRRALEFADLLAL